MSEAWKKMKKAKEEDYFDKQNREALLKLAQKKEADKNSQESPNSEEKKAGNE